MVFYLLKVEGDVEPELLGPFPDETERDEKAIELRRADPEGHNGLFALTADLVFGYNAASDESFGGLKLDIDSYSAGFFEDSL